RLVRGLNQRRRNGPAGSIRAGMRVVAAGVAGGGFIALGKRTGAECLIGVDCRDVRALGQGSKFRDRSGVEVCFVDDAGVGYRIEAREENAVGLRADDDGMYAAAERR